MTSKLAIALLWYGSCCAAAAPVEIGQPFVFFDQQANGFASSSCQTVRWNGKLLHVFQKASDAAAGLRPSSSESSDDGKTWSSPVPWMAKLFEGGPQEFLALYPFGPTRRGTLLAVGFHTRRAVRDGSYRADVRWRPGELLIGRMAKGSSDFAMKTYESGAFLGEPFVAPGLILSSGRIALTLWGARREAENWQAGVLLSDDDGATWRFRVVGPPAAMEMRDQPDMPVGFNEQTLFELPGGGLVSLLRARAKLGRIPESPRDTWFFRSESRDGGETWSAPEPTNLAGTGAPSSGITLPDGSLLTAARIPYSRTLYPLADPAGYGLHLARSADRGRTWQTARLIQKSPEGRVFDNYYNAMNGHFLPVGRAEWLYVFGEFRHKENVHRTLAVRVKASAR
ncbi:MAG: sialidase family protein [Bryobacteraceae bacterium]